LRVLGEQAGVDTLPVIAGQAPTDIARRALASAKVQGYDVVILDTAGRLAVDESLMNEAAAIHALARPVETLLVADAMTGQDAVNVARAFKERVQVTGIVLTRVDGDARGGAALSMRAEADAPVKLIGTGEKLDALEDFHPERIASRILGMGDVVSLVEKAAEHVDRQEAEKLARKMKKGDFDLDDMADQLDKLTKMGGLSSMLGMLPGARDLKQKLKGVNLDDRMIARQVALIRSMTKAERRNVKLLNGSRKRRIARGAGMDVPDVNRLVKQFLEMSKMMKRAGKLGQGGLMRSMGGGLPPGLPPGLGPR
jgi:signal recognition particle subunit SRP54